MVQDNALITDKAAFQARFPISPDLEKHFSIAGK